jgi:hypothetical protein
MAEKIPYPANPSFRELEALWVRANRGCNAASSPCPEARTGYSTVTDFARLRG